MIDGWVTFKWERVPNFCFVCGFLDHHENDCEKMINLELQGEKICKPYNAGLRADGIQVHVRKHGHHAASISRNSEKSASAQGRKDDGETLEDMADSSLIKSHASNPKVFVQKGEFVVAANYDESGLSLINYVVQLKNLRTDVLGNECSA